MAIERKYASALAGVHIKKENTSRDWIVNPTITPDEAERVRGIYQSFGEKEVVEQAQLRNADAILWVCTKYYPQLGKYFISRLHDPHKAEELTQTAIINAVTNLEKYTPSSEIPFSAWVFTVAHNTLVSSFRTEAKKKTSNISALGWVEFLENPEANVEKAAEEAVLFQEARESISKLPTESRKVMEMRFIAGLSIRETAKALGKTEGNVKSLQHNALDIIRSNMGVQKSARRVILTLPIEDEKDSVEQMVENHQLIGLIDLSPAKYAHFLSHNRDRIIFYNGKSYIKKEDLDTGPAYPPNRVIKPIEGFVTLASVCPTQRDYIKLAEKLRRGEVRGLKKEGRWYVPVGFNLDSEG